MKNVFSKFWRSSRQPRKQRKFAANAPLHLRSALLNCHLSKELRKKYGVRALRVRAGDKVRILRGSRKGVEAKVERVDVKNLRVFLTKVERQKKEGGVVPIPFHPSNLLITSLDVSDKKRSAKLAKIAEKKKSEEGR
ncbi:50S ribosomal protein L24 [Candidatus Woesearchaeota archaeon]|nr:MAG: 50S ribosomal protein L24 [Candidatus Woesearchaeota archaeon]